MIIILYIILFFFAPLIAVDKQVVTYIGAKSQSINIARELVGWEHEIHQFNVNTFYGSFSITPEVTKTFRPERLTQCLFGDDILTCKNALTISGSRTQNRVRNQDWLADYFGLPTDFKSTVHFTPQVNNFLVDINIFTGFDNWIPGLYVRIHAPLVYTNWDLNIHETIETRGNNNHDPGYFNDAGIPRQQLVQNFTAFISGRSAPQGDNITFQKLQFAKMHPCSRRLVKIAEVRAAIGYNMWHTETSRVGLNARLAIPTGNRPKADFLFEPIVGNGHHWETGIGISAHLCAWQSKETNEKIDLYLNANIMHLFSTKQKRTFDLKEKPNSRYMLAEKLGPPDENNLRGNGQEPDSQFKNEFAPVANFTTFNVDVDAAIQLDLTFLFAYTTENKYTWSFGYGIWKRSCENIFIKNLNKFQSNTWALKGDTQMVGFVAQQLNPNDLNIGTPITLSATQSTATINTGINFPKRGLSDQEATRNEQIITGKKNQRIDFPQPATAGNNQLLVASTDDVTVNNQINTSIQPVFITKQDININSAQTRGFSQKIYVHINRMWHDHNNITPYAGFGAEVDFGRRPGPTPEVPREKCINCALSQWGVWGKGGFSF